MRAPCLPLSSSRDCEVSPRPKAVHRAWNSLVNSGEAGRGRRECSRLRSEWGGEQVAKASTLAGENRHSVVGEGWLTREREKRGGGGYVYPANCCSGIFRLSSGPACFGAWGGGCFHVGQVGEELGLREALPLTKHMPPNQKIMETEPQVRKARLESPFGLARL